MTGEDKAKKTQWGGSFYPIHLRPGNLEYAVWGAEKACHLWAFLPEFRSNPKVVGGGHWNQYAYAATNEHINTYCRASTTPSSGMRTGSAARS